LKNRQKPKKADESGLPQQKANEASVVSFGFRVSRLVRTSGGKRRFATRRNKLKQTPSRDSGTERLRGFLRHCADLSDKPTKPSTMEKPQVRRNFLQKPQEAAISRNFFP
jgi:hypothetical protein